jgi:zinc/manganese transport system substrate-binding protein
MRTQICWALGFLVFAVASAGCASLGPATASSGVSVVAAESTWGTVAQALGGTSAHVTSIIADPALDPHSYEPEAADARAFATANLVIINGLGYDTWASHLIAADTPAGRTVINVGTLLGLHTGDNPHRWYSPADVQVVANAITAALIHADHAHAADYRAQRVRFSTVDLAQYQRVIAHIRNAYTGVPVGASESIFAPMATALGLDLVTPPSFLRAISEGGDVTAADMTTIQSQIAHHTVRVWVLNTQNETPDVNLLTSEAVAAHIPVVTMTETPNPEGASFASWQTRQLVALSGALRLATGH